ncbi:insecticidal delta-endotoxin Cry8Ea1 family protein [Cupriavidus necator]|uniref:Twin-arginine translocation pathway signal n=1 Tax=Cupriavidus pinatubonensis (strain JMP 134 / LMG 1197) TaxID=264198 RepID=Q476C5_CUPPJ|nr:insecticidal delta-endotoxin Cry8Ea1 family protein [Cupriavidus necator]
MLTRRDLLRSIPSAALMAMGPAFPAHADGALGKLPVTDPMEDLKTILEVVLAEVPVVGGAMSALVGLLWPVEPADVWEEIRQKVEALIEQKINDAVYSLLKSKLDGIGNTLKLYLNAAATGDTSNMRMQFIATNTQMTLAASEFRNPDFQWVLAPLFAIFSQLHAVLLRDCVLHGRDWGWNTATYEGYVRLASDTINEYHAYLDAVVRKEQDRLAPAAPTSPGKHYTAIYNYWQSFSQKKQVLFGDYMLLLNALDPIRNPGQVKTIPFPDVFSAAYGTADDWDATCRAWAGAVATPFSLPAANISEIYIELFNFTPRIVDVSYPAGSGPKVWGGNRQDRTGIIADRVSGVEQKTISIPRSTDGKTFNIAGASIRAGSIPTAVSLVMDDGKSIALWDRRDLGGQQFYVSVPGRKLTTLNMWSRSRFYDNDLGCIIFGFSRDPSDIPPAVREALYVTAIQPPSVGPRFLPSTVSRDAQYKRDRFWQQVRSARPAQ